MVLAITVRGEDLTECRAAGKFEIRNSKWWSYSLCHCERSEAISKYQKFLLVKSSISNGSDGDRRQ